MVKLRCQDCGKVIEGKKADVDDSECNCGGSYAIMGSEDDEYEPQQCPICKKELEGDADTWQCEECDEEGICEDCIIEFENANNYFCKPCVNKAYPRPQETKIEYQEKIVEKPVKVYVDKEGNPLDVSFNPYKKSKFD